MRPDKLVCGCREVRVAQLMAAVDAGCRAFSEVKRRTGVALGCGRCEEYARNVFDALLQERLGREEDQTGGERS